MPNMTIDEAQAALVTAKKRYAEAEKECDAAQLAIKEAYAILDAAFVEADAGQPTVPVHEVNGFYGHREVITAVVRKRTSTGLWVSAPGRLHRSAWRRFLPPAKWRPDWREYGRQQSSYINNADVVALDTAAGQACEVDNG